MPSVLHTIRRMTRDDVRTSPTRAPTKRHGWIAPPRLPTDSPDEHPEEEYSFFGTPRIASSCSCTGCWATPLAAHNPATVAATVRDRKPLPFLPTRRKPAPKLDKDELQAMREAYPSPPPETRPDPLERCASPESAYSLDEDSLVESEQIPDNPPPVPEKDDVQAVRAQYEPVSAAELKSLYDEIWDSLPDEAGSAPGSAASAASATSSTVSASVVSVRFPTPDAAPPSPVTTSGCASCSACVARARSHSSVSSVASASHAALGRSPRRPRRPTLGAPSYAIVDPAVVPMAPRARSSTKRRRAHEAAMRRVTPTKPSALSRQRPHPGGPRPLT